MKKRKQRISLLTGKPMSPIHYYWRWFVEYVWWERPYWMGKWLWP